MKKIIPKILILLIIVQLFAPFGFVIKDRNISLVNNEASAKDNSFNLEGKGATWDVKTNDTTATVSVKIDTKKVSSNGFIFEKLDAVAYFVNKETGGKEGDGGSYKGTLEIPLKSSGENAVAGSSTITGLKASTTYSVRLAIYTRTSGLGETDQSYQYYDQTTKDIPTEATGTTQQTTKYSGNTTLTEQEKKIFSSGSDLPPCGITSGSKIMGCVAQGMYYLFFKPTSYIFAASGKLLDVTLMYSISDNSYRSNFVTNGWGVVRDFCNMFFIFILLYVAFGTILDLNGVKTKEIIVHVIIIGILINFSLFATKIIIDASNILARVFYNQNTIAITTDNNGSKKSELGDFGEIKLSELIVSKVNPTIFLSKASEVEQIQIKSDINEENVDDEDSSTATTTDTSQATYTPKTIDVGGFIVVVILSTILNVIGIVTFVTCGFIFVVRVVGLWIAMILVPLAFFTYAVPELQNFEMIGWKKWWSETLSLAFAAPIFAFFMYIVVAFMDKGLGTAWTSIQNSKPGLSMVTSVLVPYIFIMALLMQAKNITKRMSGKLGDMAANGASSVLNLGKSVALGAGGVVAGGAIGAGAGMLRGTLGRAGGAIANSERLKASETKGGFGGFISKNLRNVGNATGKGSFDIRGLKVGNKTLSQMSIGGKSLDGLGFKTGKPKEGGFEGRKYEKIAKRQKRMKELEVGENSEETQNVREAEIELNRLKTDRNRQDQLEILNNGDRNAAPGSLESMGTGALEREVIARDRAVADAERTLRDAINALNTINANANAAAQERQQAQDALNAINANANATKQQKQQAQDALNTADNNVNALNQQKQQAQIVVDNAKTDRDAEIRGGNRSDGTIVQLGRDQARINLEDRQAAIRGLEGPIRNAERTLRELQNVVTQTNNIRRENYAQNITNPLSQTINFITSGGQHSFSGEREAANKIRAGIKEEKK